MSTDKQFAANRANARRSTGPRTPAGKTRSAQNARKHSFSGDAFTIIKIEERDAVDRLRADLIAAYAPQNSQELFAIERIALAQHNLLRLAKFESGLFTLALNRAFRNIGEEIAFYPLHEELHVDAQEVKAQNRNYALATGFHNLVRESERTWTLFLRYQNQAERHYRRAVEEFERLKKLRAELPNEPISEAQPEATAPTSPPENEPAATPFPDAAEPPASPHHIACGTPPLSPGAKHKNE